MSMLSSTNRVPNRFTSLPLLASKNLPTEPPEMFTTLPLLALKSSPTEPPEMFTSTCVLVPLAAPAAAGRAHCSEPEPEGVHSGFHGAGNSSVLIEDRPVDVEREQSVHSRRCWIQDGRNR